MRREDKLRLLPKVTFTVPEGFYLEPCPDHYRLYAVASFGSGIMRRLVCTYDGAVTEPEVQAAVAQYAVSQHPS